MRRSRTLLIGGLMVVGLLIGPGAGAAAAGPASTPSSGATGWQCSPNGTGGGSPTTTTSSALIYESNMSSSKITCFFPSIAVPVSLVAGGLLPSHLELSGTCLYENGNDFVSFQHRIYAVHGNTASLVCWGGQFECRATAKAAAIQACELTATAKGRRSAI